jgi:hypothetical protein
MRGIAVAGSVDPGAGEADHPLMGRGHRPRLQRCDQHNSMNVAKGLIATLGQ